MDAKAYSPPAPPAFDPIAVSRITQQILSGTYRRAERATEGKSGTGGMSRSNSMIREVDEVDAKAKAEVAVSADAPPRPAPSLPMDGNERLAAFQAFEAYEQTRAYEETRAKALEAHRQATAAKEREVEAKEREVEAKAREEERLRAWEAARAISMAAKVRITRIHCGKFYTMKPNLWKRAQFLKLWCQTFVIHLTHPIPPYHPTYHPHPTPHHTL